MPSKNAYMDFLIEQFSPLGEVTARSMFGGYCLYCDGTVFGLVANNALYLKADDVNRPEFEARGSEAFCSFEDKPAMTMSYYEAPPQIFEDADEMRRWVGGAVQAGVRAKKPERRRKTAKRAGSA